MELLTTTLLGPLGLTIGALVLIRQLFVLLTKERESTRQSIQDQQDHLSREADSNRTAFMEMIELLKGELATCNEHRVECNKSIMHLTHQCAQLQERLDQMENPIKDLLARIETQMPKSQGE